MRVKRGAVPKVFGTFMRGPARRGRPRISQSDEEHSPMEENANSNDVGSSQEPQSQESQYERPEMQRKSPTPEVELARRAPVSSYRDFAASGSPPSSNDPLNSVSHSRSPPPPTSSSSRRPDPRSTASPTNQQPAFKLPAPRPGLPASHDQENEAPPTFRRNKQPLMHINSAEKQNRPDGFEMNSVRATGSPERRPLATRSQNTPRRPAPPPPPKMSVLEAATSTAGAATTSHANSRRNRLRVNGKVFTRLDVIGRGGSSKVYRVMAENSKIFALKRVSLEDADESAIRGFKGEIDLLKKLGSVERVIHLYDYEMNDERGILSVLMEMGELDMNTILNVRMKSEHARLDLNFVRYYWKEMLECLQAIHAYDIVHSDLKPHNFVLVQGRLKLIDFGIANAIQTEETVNVHRETQIGTPNYMSPESLMDSNASDAYGVGGILVPSSLIRTLKNCLNRDQHQRPSAEELLGDNDRFLNPLEIDMDKHFPMTEELLGRILQNVIQKCETLGRVPSEVELLTAWPKGYFTSLRKAEQRGGT
ncbi:hypothetical protein DID88_002718 [Monilinia fructigena]|uniref:Protein kinase domain-containing protein n=1 Tax=Monilinia fructigena TaxID=38457 RepID=A0A395ITH4_9HELO|nr:hypothetical protein DID88_002718 [Monilinia fructigena]